MQHRAFTAFPRLADIMSPEVNSFGVLRMAMATAVLISHSFLYCAGTSEAEPLVAWFGRSLGEYAVQIFFILSGVMVAQSLERSRSLFDFTIARLLRIFPALIVCVLLSSLILGPVVSHMTLADYLTSPVLYGYVMKTLTLSTGAAPLPGVFETIPFSGYVNSSLWTLKYEVICYFGLALFGAAGFFEKRRLPVAILALLLLVTTVSLTLPADPAAFGLVENLRYFTVFFFAGVLAYHLRSHLVIAGPVLVPLFALFVALARTPFAEVSSALFLGYAALWAATKMWGPLRGICNRVDASFGIYIFAGPIQQTLLWLMPALTPVWLTLTAVALVLPIAVLSWLVIERPALRFRPAVASFLDRQRTSGVRHAA
jgi:peptidoglycan/LPS O-acetylase OafA/YrhL